MQPAPKLQIELSRARSAYEAMKSSHSLPELEEQWREFLGRLERVWFKAYSHYKKSPKWQSWKTPYEKARSDPDQLISYLRFTRGKDEHSLEEIVEHQQAHIAIVPGEHGGTIKDLRIYSNGMVTAKTTGTAGVEFNPARIRLLPTTYRAVTYFPRDHQGTSVNPDNVFSAAEAGLNFYDQFLQEAEQFFVK